MKSIGEVLAKKKPIIKRSGARYEWQDAAVRWWQKLGISGKPESSWFKEFKLHRAQIEKACSWVSDYWATKDTKKLVYWKVQQILKGL